MSDHERRVLDAADAFLRDCPALVAIRAFNTLPTDEAGRAGHAYAALFEAILDYIDSLPIDEQIARHRLGGAA